ncbi:MAG TPA: TIM barrel protein [Limnochordia bacterium]|nr:TIM barrel protein [Limnochordia bacterium]
MFEWFTSSVLYGEQSFERACGEIAGLGLERVDLWQIPGWCEHLREGPAAVSRTLARHGLQLEAISAFNQPLAATCELLPVLADLGGHALVMGSAKPDVSVNEFAGQIEPLVVQAERLGVTLAIENHNRAVIDSLNSMQQLVARLPSPGLSIALAPIHLHNIGESVPAAIRAMADRIGLFYVWDWGQTSVKNWKDPAEQFVGTGEIDYPPIFAALRASGYARPLCVFAHGPEHWPPERTTAELGAALARARALAAGA